MASNENNDSGNESPTKEKPENKLNAREQEQFAIAMMYCLKSGRPQINYQKFMEMGNFNTLKTAQNTWGKIKAKLPVLDGEEEDEARNGGAVAKATPKSTKSSTKKRTASVKKEAGDDDDEVMETPTKKPRKSPAKKKVVAWVDEDEGLAKAEPVEED